MDNLISLRVFATVAELRSFTAAASRLRLSPAMVSKHVLHLEKRLSTRLLHRTSRRVGLTEAGARYLEQIRPALAELDAADATIIEGVAEPSGTLRITAPVWLANPTFASIVAAYRIRYPEVVPDISFDGRLADLVSGGIDLALRVTAVPDPGLVMRKLAIVPFLLVASPAFLAAQGSLDDLAGLQGRDLLAYAHVQPEGHMTWEWPEGRQSIQFHVVARSDNEAFLRDAAIAGMGMAFLPDWLIDDHLRSGALVPVLPGRATFEATLHAVYVSRRHLPAKVRTFIDYLAEHCERA